MYSTDDLITLKEWALRNPQTNPFSNCLNIGELGGADLYWDEFKYRYKQRKIFDTDEFISAIERCFRYNQYKYNKLYQTTLLAYNTLYNYMVKKSGQEENTLNLNKQKTGTDTVTPNITITETPAEKITKTETPTIKTKETTTPNVTEATTRTPNTTKTAVETPRAKITEIETPRVSTTTTTNPADYTDSLYKTTFDSTTERPVQQTTRAYDALHPETVTTTPTAGENTKTTEGVSGTNTTETKETGTETTNKNTTGTNTKNFEYVSGNTTTETSHSGTNKEVKTGTEQTTYGSNVKDTGTETLEYKNRVDEGYMYRPPQDAIEDERKIAMFTLLDIIFSDVEQATLLSIY